MGDDSSKGCSEVTTNVQVAKKQQRPRYFAPMSMTKIANVAKKRRVIAPNVTDSLTIKDKTMGELIASNRTRQNEEFKQDLAKPACMKRGSNKHLFLVDEDDDEDDDIIQDYVDQDDV